MRGKFIAVLAVCLLCAMTHRIGAETIGSIVGIHAAADSLRIDVEGIDRPVELVELRPYEVYSASKKQRVAWQGNAGATSIKVPRFDGKRDRLYSKFQLVDAGTGQPLGFPHYADDLSQLPARDFDFHWPKSVKGLSGIVDLDDLIRVGVKYAKDNVNVDRMIARSDNTPYEEWEVDGQKVRMNLNYFRELDARYKKLTDAGVNVSVVVLIANPRKPANNVNPLIHPDAVPGHFGAFNLTDEPGLLHYRACMEYFANRYSDPSSKHGWVANYIIGNEVQAHWAWYNMGEATSDEVVSEYAKAVRIAWLAVRRFHTQPRVYISLCHYWNSLYRDNPLYAMTAPELIEKMARITREEGDFPWHVAYHSYPQNLRDPRFWNDELAWMSFDAPMITFKNLEVLPAFLRQEHLLYRGKPRRIILSEQGLHCMDGPDGEKVQAAAFAYAWHKIRHMPEIDAFQFSRHVDSRRKNGYRFGLWSEDETADTKFVPKKKRLLYDVYRLADTPQWEEAFAFALPVIGIESWDEALPSTEPILHRRSPAYAFPGRSTEEKGD